MSEFEAAFAKFLKEQQATANPRRLERLNGDLTGEKKLLEVLWQVFGSFDGITLEYELISTTGVKVYVDTFYEPLRLCFESEGFVAHAENITRDRFDFEKMKVRTIALYRYVYIPFTWDELNKKTEACRRFLYSLLGRQVGDQLPDLSLYERELLRYAIRLGRPFRLEEARTALNIGVSKTRQVVRRLYELQLIRPTGGGSKRFHEFVVTEKGYAFAGI